MTIKEPENNTDYIKMDKIKHGRNKQYKRDEGSIKPHLPTGRGTAENSPSTPQQGLLLRRGGLRAPPQDSVSNRQAHIFPELHVMGLLGVSVLGICVGWFLQWCPLRLFLPRTTAKIFPHILQLRF